MRGIAVYCADPALKQEANRLSFRCGLPLIATPSPLYRYLLHLKADQLELSKTGAGKHGPIFVDFTHGPLGYRIQQREGRSQYLARAIGLKPGRRVRIIDATAGLGKDGFILAALGCEVTMLERSPVIAALLDDGLERALKQSGWLGDVASRISLHQADAITTLPPLSTADQPDVIYLDPMYPARGKKALVKKELRVLRDLAGMDEDADELLEISRGCALCRVVVKRPRLAQNLNGPKPSHTINGKTTRYDVYLTH